MVLFALLPSVFLWSLSSSCLQLFTDGYWSWDVLGECLHLPLQPAVGSWTVHPMCTLHPLSREAGTLILVDAEVLQGYWGAVSLRVREQSAPAQTPSKTPGGGISAMARSISCSISLLCSQRSESLLASWHPVSSTKLDRMTSHPQRCSMTSLDQGRKHMKEGCSSFLRTLLSSHDFAFTSFHGNMLAHSPPVTGQRHVCARSESCCQNEPKDKHFKAS